MLAEESTLCQRLPQLLKGGPVANGPSISDGTASLDTPAAGWVQLWHWAGPHYGWMIGYQSIG